MAMCTKPIIKCYVERTNENLKNYEGNFEVTQRINSLLSLLIFPAQLYFPKDAKKEYKEKVQKLLEEYEITLSSLPTSTINKIDLYDYIRKLRNGVAHGHIIPETISGDDIDRLKIWNINDLGKKDFEIIFDLQSKLDIKSLIENFSNFLENISSDTLFNGVKCFDFKYKGDKRVIAFYDKNYECCSFKFYKNNLICLSNCKTKNDKRCKYLLDERVLRQIVEILKVEFHSLKIDSNCKINQIGTDKIFWKELEAKDLAIFQDSIYTTKIKKL